MDGWHIWLLIGLIAFWLVLLGYWQLIIAEGAYLGQRIVTWLYDLAAHRYDDIKQYTPKMEADFLGRPLADALRSLDAPLVLDVATGTARLPLTLLEQGSFRGQIVGLDHSRRMLAVAAEKTEGFDHRLTLIWCNAADLPFPDDSIDVVTCLEMLEFTPSPEAQLAEVIRVLHPGGLLLTTRRRGLNRRLMPGKTHSRLEFEVLLEELGMTRIIIQGWQVEYDLVWGVKAGRSEHHIRHPLDVLRCPACDSVGRWHEDPHRLTCAHCANHYPISRRIIEMLD